MTGSQLLGTLTGLPAELLKLPVVFIRAGDMLQVTGVVADTPERAADGPHVLLLLSGGLPLRHLEPPLPSIGDRGRF